MGVTTGSHEEGEVDMEEEEEEVTTTQEVEVVTSTIITSLTGGTNYP